MWCDVMWCDGPTDHLSPRTRRWPCQGLRGPETIKELFRGWQTAVSVVSEGSLVQFDKFNHLSAGNVPRRPWHCHYFSIAWSQTRIVWTNKTVACIICVSVCIVFPQFWIGWEIKYSTLEQTGPGDRPCEEQCIDGSKCWISGSCFISKWNALAGGASNAWF